MCLAHAMINIKTKSLTVKKNAKVISLDAFPIRNCVFEPRREKTNILVSDMVRHKPGCTATEGG